MANGIFPTGVSRQPLDVATAGQNFLQAAVEQKLANIEADREQVSESAKNVLKAMSIKTLDGLSRGLQNKYQKEIQDYRSKVVDKFRTKEGKLSLDDKVEIQNGFVDLQQRQLSDIAALKERAKARELITDPNFPYGFDAQSAVNEMVKWDKAMERGEYLGDPVAMVMKHRKEPEMGDYIDKAYGEEVATLDVESLAGFDGNVFTQTELSGLSVQARDSLEKARRLRDRIMLDPNVKARYTAADGTIFEDRLNETRQAVEDLISRKISASKPYRQTTRGGSGSGSDLRSLSQKTVDLASGTYPSYVDYPRSQAEKRFTVNEALNEETGRMDRFDEAASMRVIGFDVPNNRVFFVSEGGELKDNGQTVYGGAGIISDAANVNEKLEEGYTKERIKEQPVRFLADATDRVQNVNDVTRVTNLEFDETEDGRLVVTGNLEKWRTKQFVGIGGKRVSAEELNPEKHVKESEESFRAVVSPLSDPKSTTRYSLPLSDYEEVVSELYQYGIEGTSVPSFYKQNLGNSGTRSNNGQYVVNGKQYTEKQLLRQYKEMYPDRSEEELLNAIRKLK